MHVVYWAILESNLYNLSPDFIYQFSLTQVPQIGAVQARILVNHFGDASSVFKARKKELAALDNIGEIRAANIKNFDDFSKADSEISFMEKYKIEPLFITDKDYPQRLLHCHDAPTLLYYRGNANLNAAKIISVIGTRNNSDYGKHFTEQLVNDLCEQQVLIISGLAFGIDAIAHKAAVQKHMPTIGVLAHGLETIYPSQHKNLAKEMILQGGLLTEFTHNQPPDKHHFPRRNRIVAGMADATIVVETALKGGSMITAELANNYNRDVFAVPGKTTDAKSAGCNHLIKVNKAALLTDAQALMEMMGWQPKKINRKLQQQLFIELSDDEQVITRILSSKENMPIDELYLKSGLSSSAVAAAILNLELQNIVASLPGKLYKLL